MRNGDVVQLARHTGLKILHEDTLRIRTPPSLPVNKGDSRISYSTTKVTHAFLLLFYLSE